MPLTRIIAMAFLALGFALGSVIGVAAATEQALAQPCPMHDLGADEPCCKGDCTGAMAGCSVKCSVPFGAVPLPDNERLVQGSGAQLVAWDPNAYDPFVARPPPPIPIV
jgi:hypothetical protein